MSTYKVTDKTFEDITNKKVKNTSYIKLFNILKDDTDYYLNIFRFYEINETLLNDLLHFYTTEINDDDFFDLISYNTYDNSNLWWLICLTNNVINPFEEVEVGKNIKILKDFLVPYTLKEISLIAEK